MTHAYAILDVSAAAFDEIKALLAAAGYEHAFHDDVIDMHGIAVRARAEPLVLWAECHEPRDAHETSACGWTGEMGQLVDRDGIKHCPNCGSTAIKEDIDPNATKDPTP